MSEFVNKYARDCVATFEAQGKTILHIMPVEVPEFAGDPSTIEAEVERLISIALPMVEVTAHINGHRMIETKLVQRLM